MLSRTEGRRMRWLGSWRIQTTERRSVALRDPGAGRRVVVEKQEAGSVVTQIQVERRRAQLKGERRELAAPGELRRLDEDRGAADLVLVGGIGVRLPLVVRQAGETVIGNERRIRALVKRRRVDILEARLGLGFDSRPRGLCRRGH